jgi:hypothetical protein
MTFVTVWVGLERWRLVFLDNDGSLDKAWGCGNGFLQSQ